jgi:trk system potassium uptake protein TrkA
MKRYKDRRYAVLGLGIFGSAIAKTLAKNGCEVIAIDQDIACVNRIVEHVSSAIACDVKEVSQLRAAGLAEVDVAIIAMGSHLEESVMAIINLKELGVGYIVAKAKNKRYKQIFESLGVNRVVRPEKEMGEQVARSVLGQNIIDLIDLDDDHSIVELPVPSTWIGKSLIELDVRRRYQMNIIAIRDQQKLNISPAAEYRLQANDHIMVIVDNRSVDQLDFIK